MNKLEFVHEVGDLANRFAFLFKNYVASHDGYDDRTEDGSSIIMANINVSIQNGELATIDADIGGVNSKHRIRINKYPNSEETIDWRIEER